MLIYKFYIFTIYVVKSSLKFKHFFYLYLLTLCTMYFETDQTKKKRNRLKRKCQRSTL